MSESHERGGNLDETDSTAYIGLSRALVPRDVGVVVVDSGLAVESRTCVERHIFTSSSPNENDESRTEINRIRSAVSSQRHYRANRAHINRRRSDRARQRRNAETSEERRNRLDALRMRRIERAQVQKDDARLIMRPTANQQGNEPRAAVRGVYKIRTRVRKIEIVEREHSFEAFNGDARNGDESTGTIVRIEDRGEDGPDDNGTLVVCRNVNSNNGSIQEDGISAEGQAAESVYEPTSTGAEEN